MGWRVDLAEAPLMMMMTRYYFQGKGTALGQVCSTLPWSLEVEGNAPRCLVGYFLMNSRRARHGSTLVEIGKSVSLLSAWRSTRDQM